MRGCRSSKESQKAELAAAEARGKADAEKNAVQKALDDALARAEAEQSSLQAAIQRLEHDAKEYKVPCPEGHSFVLSTYVQCCARWQR